MNRPLALALLALCLAALARPAAGAAGPALRVDAAADARPISPDIYGMNYPDPALAGELGLSVQRWGGNATSRYNWKIDVSNRGSDYFFQNIPEGGGAGLPDGSTVNAFIEAGRQRGVATLLTVPLIGWTPARRPPGDSHPYDCGFKVSRYGPQQRVDPYDPDCGNGLRGDGAPVAGNDPGDTSVAIGPAFVTEWVAYLAGRYGRADAGGVRYYSLDNEPGLWHETHRDVHPEPATFRELADRSVAYAAAVKAADPGALTLGPVQDGWTRYFFASYLSWEQASADRAANGGLDFVPWYLGQLRQQERERGVRLLDYLDLHYYPQSPGVTLAPAGSAETQARRLRTTRSLWDPSYIDESWISTTEAGGVAVRLIPRMRAWVDEHYPGTRLAITEYNFGGLESVNGALAQADALGIFGREGLDLATLWAPPAPDEPGAFAFRMFRNYDGAGGRFGETSVRAASADQGRLAIYAARRADGALTALVINKTDEELSSGLSLTGFAAGPAAAVYRYSAARPAAIVAAGPLPVAGGAITASYPAQSITLLVLPPAQALDRRLYLPGVLR